MASRSHGVLHHPAAITLDECTGFNVIGCSITDSEGPGLLLKTSATVSSMPAASRIVALIAKRLHPSASKTARTMCSRTTCCQTECKSGDLNIKLHSTLFMRLLSLLFVWLLAMASAAPAEVRSPVNQVFQFMQRGTLEYAPGDVVKTVAYLWIPERCDRVRGLLIMGENVTEHGLVGHPAIRAACESCDPSMNSRRSSRAPA